MRNAKLKIAAIIALMFAASASPASLTLSWKDNSDNETGFIVERKTGSGPWVAIHQTAPDIETYIDPSVEFGILYTYRVKAYNSSGESGYTNEATGQVDSGIVITLPPVIVKPNSPSAITVTVTTVIEVEPTP